MAKTIRLVFTSFKFPSLLLGLLIVIQTSVEANDEPLAEFSIDSPRSLISVPVHTLGGKFDFIIDTGATLSVYSSTLNWPGEPVKVEIARTASRDREVPLYRRPPTRIGQLQIPGNDLVVAIDFTELSGAWGRRIDGLIGMDVLNRYVIQLDFDARIVRFLNAAPADCGTRIPLGLSRQKQPTIPVEVAGEQIEARIDTGSAKELDVSLTRWRKLQSQNRLSRTRVIKLASAGGIVYSNQALIDGFKVADDSFDKIQIGTNQVESIGVGFLARYLVTFDFPNKAIYLKPGKLFSTPLPRDASGISLISKDEQIVIAAVAEGSPASKKGIKKGDCIVSVNSQAAKNWSLTELRNLMTKSGDVVVLTVKRENQSFEFSVSLDDY